MCFPVGLLSAFNTKIWTTAGGSRSFFRLPYLPTCSVSSTPSPCLPFTQLQVSLLSAFKTDLDHSRRLPFILSAALSANLQRFLDTEPVPSVHSTPGQP